MTALTGIADGISEIRCVTLAAIQDAIRRINSVIRRIRQVGPGIHEREEMGRVLRACGGLTVADTIRISGIDTVIAVIIYEIIACIP